METTTNTLPNKLSALIEVAIQDARKLDRIRYSPNHLHYHSPQESWKSPVIPCCEVCDAGAVMAGTLRVIGELNIIPGDFDESTQAKNLRRST